MKKDKVEADCTKRATDLFARFGHENTLTPQTRTLIHQKGVQDACSIILAGNNNLADGHFKYSFFDAEHGTVEEKTAALIWDGDYPTRRSTKNLGLHDCKGLDGISSIGLDGMDVLGHLVLGPQPSEKRIDELKASAEESHRKLAVIDLRAEFHFFLDGTPFSFFFPEHNWTNMGRSASDIEADAEKIRDRLKIDLAKRLDAGQQIEFATKNKVKKGNFETTLAGKPPQVIEFEKSALERLETPRQFYARKGVAYILAPTSDHVADTVEGIDACDAALRQLINAEGEDNLLLYGQCVGGYGRTTALGIREDCRKNAHSLTAEEIATRQEEWRAAPSKAGNPVYETPRLEKKDVDSMYHRFRQEVPFDKPVLFAEWLEAAAIGSK